MLRNQMLVIYREADTCQAVSVSGTTKNKKQKFSWLNPKLEVK